MQEKKPCSLLAKWLPSAKGKDRDSHRMGKQIQEALGWTNKQYNKTLSSLRKYINIVERQMSANQWEDIDYQAVPSRANLIYNSAFLRHDESRRRNFLEAVNKGEKKNQLINPCTHMKLSQNTMSIHLLNVIRT